MLSATEMLYKSLDAFFEARLGQSIRIPVVEPAHESGSVFVYWAHSLVATRPSIAQYSSSFAGNGTMLRQRTTAQPEVLPITLQSASTASVLTTGVRRAYCAAYQLGTVIVQEVQHSGGVWLRRSRRQMLLTASAGHEVLDDARYPLELASRLRCRSGRVVER